jgi:hypothetical protein
MTESSHYHDKLHPWAQVTKEQARGYAEPVDELRQQINECVAEVRSETNTALEIQKNQQSALRKLQSVVASDASLVRYLQTLLTEWRAEEREALAKLDQIHHAHTTVGNSGIQHLKETRDTKARLERVQNDTNTLHDKSFETEQSLNNQLQECCEGNPEQDQDSQRIQNLISELEQVEVSRR